jgi:hypothetical protein
MCFGVRDGSRRGVCMEARAASSQALGMVCPRLEAMQTRNIPTARTALRWVVLWYLIATECRSEEGHGE